MDWVERPLSHAVRWRVRPPVLRSVRMRAALWGASDPTGDETAGRVTNAAPEPLCGRGSLWVEPGDVRWSVRVSEQDFCQ